MFWLPVELQVDVPKARDHPQYLIFFSRVFGGLFNIYK